MKEEPSSYIVRNSFAVEIILSEKLSDVTLVGKENFCRSLLAIKISIQGYFVQIDGLFAIANPHKFS